MAEIKYQSVHKGDTIDEVVTDYMKRKQGGVNAETDILLDKKAVRVIDSSENEYPMAGNTMQVLDIDTFDALPRLLDNVLYVVVKEPQSNEIISINP